MLSSASSRRRRPPRSGRVFILRRIVALLVLAAAFVLVWFLVSLFQPFTGPGHGRVKLTIPRGASVDDIASTLAQDHVISSSFFFKLAATIDGDRGKLRAGQYKMKLGMNYTSALDQLVAGPNIRYSNVLIIPGHTRRQIQVVLRKSGIKGNYLVATRHSSLLDPTVYGAPRSTPTLEGFLWPDTYNLRQPVKMSALIDDQLTRFKQEFAKVKLGYAKSKNLTAYDVLKIASLISEEAMLKKDLPRAAAVIYNRLRMNMDLGLDSTVAYATGNYGTLTEQDLRSKSRWNTTNHPGLPPTPIDNPDLAAINAAAHPAHINAVYFINKVCGNGALRFTASYHQFLQWSADWSAAVAKAARDHRDAEFCKGSRP
ncbi:MAG TPA: endolytic transglycosylase MltG [Solirubrobacteraceae bacterium]|nr:endolytic transglycosylase MltG [Solirubrobacteraceae bacterium]